MHDDGRSFVESHKFTSPILILSDSQSGKRFVFRYNLTRWENRRRENTQDCFRQLPAIGWDGFVESHKLIGNSHFSDYRSTVCVFVQLSKTNTQDCFRGWATSYWVGRWRGHIDRVQHTWWDKHSSGKPVRYHAHHENEGYRRRNTVDQDEAKTRARIQGERNPRSSTTKKTSSLQGNDTHWIQGRAMNSFESSTLMALKPGNKGAPNNEISMRLIE